MCDSCEITEGILKAGSFIYKASEKEPNFFEIGREIEQKHWANAIYFANEKVASGYLGFENILDPKSRTYLHKVTVLKDMNVCKSLCDKFKGGNMSNDVPNRVIEKLKEKGKLPESFDKTQHYFMYELGKTNTIFYCPVNAEDDMELIIPYQMFTADNFKIVSDCKREFKDNPRRIDDKNFIEIIEGHDKTEFSFNDDPLNI